MNRAPYTVSAAVARLWKTDAPLTIAGLAMLPVLTFAAAGLLLDPRLIAGAPAWLKPAKFAASALIYSLTLTWMFGYLDGWVRTRRHVGRITAGVFVLEVGLVCLQAWRGTTSHFNVGTPFDAVVFSVMGVAIVAQTIASGFVLVALWRQPFTDRALGTALRAGMLITLLGAASAGLMTQPTAAQLRDARESGTLPVAGAHTVGGMDGGPGLPGTNWSTAHGDLRVPHFVGLHAMQALPLVAFLMRRRRSAAPRTVARAAVSYGALFALLLLQALRGEPLASPNPVMLALFAVWAALSVVGIWTAMAARPAGGGTASSKAAAVY